MMTTDCLHYIDDDISTRVNVAEVRGDYSMTHTTARDLVDLTQTMHDARHLIGDVRRCMFGAWAAGHDLRRCMFGAQAADWRNICTAACSSYIYLIPIYI